MVNSSFLKGRRPAARQWRVGSDGWTTFTPSSDSITIYVSNSGSDSNNGTSKATAVASMQKAYQLVNTGGRNFKPDRILFRRGDTFSNGWQGTSSDGFGNQKGNPSWGISGRSRYEPFVIGAYSDDDTLTLPRPVIVPSSPYWAESFFNTIQNNANCLAIQSIEFYNRTIDPDSAYSAYQYFTGTTSSGSAVVTGIPSTSNLKVGMTLAGPGVSGLRISSVDSSTQVTLNSNVSYPCTGVQMMGYFFYSGSAGLTFNGHPGFFWLEDVYLNYTNFEFNQGNPQTDAELTLNRVTMKGFHCPDSLAQGIFIADLPLQPIGKKTLTHECVFYQMGWHPKVPRATTGGGRSHNAYCHDIHRQHDFVRSLTANSGGNGYMQRNGSNAYGNSYVGNAYGGVWGTGIRPNPLSSHDNSFIQGSDQWEPDLIAVSATGIGVTPATITFSGVPTNTAGTSTYTGRLYNRDNPGSLDATGLTVSSLASGGLTFNLSGAIGAGSRGNGVQAGDRITTFVGVSVGFTVATSLGIPVMNPAGISSGTVGYSAGFSGPFPVYPDDPIPSYVTTGMRVACYHNVGGSFQKFSGTTTVATIAADRLSFTTSEPLLASLAGGTYGVTIASGAAAPQATFVFFDGSTFSVSDIPSNRFGPNNIMANSECKSATGASSALILDGNSINVDASGNYFYKWCTSTSSNINDVGYNNTTSGQSLNSNSTVAAYDAATIEGYMNSLGISPATKDEFFSRCFANRLGSYDSRFTGWALNNYIRGCFGVSPMAAADYSEFPT